MKLKKGLKTALLSLFVAFLVGVIVGGLSRCSSLEKAVKATQEEVKTIGQLVEDKAVKKIKEKSEKVQKKLK